MRKSLVLILIILITPFIGGFYGIIHDQLTYTISPEYYTKFKFYQFGFMDYGQEAIFPNPRVQVSIVGFLATWWMGPPIGFILGIIGLRQPDSRRMFKVTMKAVLIAVIVAFFMGIVGLVYGKLFLVGKEVSWWLPENLIDTDSFITVGSIHNFSYAGGILGLVVGIIYSIKKTNKP